MKPILSTVLAAIKWRSVQVIAILFFYFLLAAHLPQQIHQMLYTISLLIKDLLMWLLPLTVGLFIAQAISSFRKQALLFIATLVLFETCSNLSSVWYAYFGGHVATHFLPPLHAFNSVQQEFSALWRFPFVRPDWWAADKGAFTGLFLGCMAAMSKKGSLRNLIEQGKKGAEWTLTRVFARMIPLFILGFVARMHQTNMFHHLMGHYAALVLWLILFLLGYLIIIFLVAANFSGRLMLKNMKNLFPAGAIAFTSGCSISTMPWTIKGAAKNLRDPSFASAVIPATTNIQQIGDCIANTFLCFLLYQHFFGYSPDWLTWVQFSVIFVLARFATAAVIGGAIFIMLPIYEAYLSFNPEMIAIILAFNVILDPIITSCNVVANGGLCRVYEKMWLALQSRMRPFLSSIEEK